MSIKAAIKRPLRRAYFRYQDRRGKTDPYVALLRKYGVNLVLDVGANQGQYARRLIKKGYQGKIISFEPLPDAFEHLKRRSESNPLWTAMPIALGDRKSTATLHIAGNSQSSSLHPMLDRHVASAPESAYTGEVEVQVDRLDAIIDQFTTPETRVFLKVDVQGHESEVISGALGCLDRIVGAELELSLVNLYQGQSLWQETIAGMKSKGFELATMEPCFVDPETDAMLQADGVFVRPTAVCNRCAA